MASLLESSIKRQVASAFKGQLLRGTIRRTTPAGLDSYGDPASATTADYAFEGIRENFSLRFIADAGIPATDVKILVLAGSIKPVTVPMQDDKILIVGKWHQVRKVLAIDPAGATYTLQVFEIP